MDRKWQGLGLLALVLGLLADSLELQDRLKFWPAISTANEAGLFPASEPTPVPPSEPIPLTTTTPDFDPQGDVQFDFDRFDFLDRSTQDSFQPIQQAEPTSVQQH